MRAQDKGRYPFRLQHHRSGGAEQSQPVQPATGHIKMPRMVVIGGGAAGFFCAVNAARLHPAMEVIIAEKGNRVLNKVRVSGGGRCNVTHACFEPAEMIKKYPRGTHFVKKAFHQFFTTDTIEWFSA